MGDPKKRWKELATVGHFVGSMKADSMERLTQMQKRTFTNWVNLHLRDRILMVRDLFTDFENGVLLINLVEIISGSRSVGKYNKTPKIINQKMENVQMVLDFLQKEGIKLVNIGCNDIVEGNEKLILGLIWTLILRYHIQKGSGDSNAKSELLRWVRSKIPQYDIKNFTSDWNSGKALCALVNALKRGTCPDHRTLEGTSVEIALKGITLAETELNIPFLVSAEDMTDPKIDDLSMMTYISFFRNLDPDISEPPIAEGSGLVEGEIRGSPSFIVKKNKTKGDYLVTVQGPTGPVEVKAEAKDKEDYINVVYFPMDQGSHEIHVTLDGEHITGSPFTSKVTLGISAVLASGPGLVKGNPGEQADFTVEPNGFDGDLKIVVKDASGQELPVQVEKNEEGTYVCSYLPAEIGEYRVDISMNGQVVPSSPFTARFGLDVSAVRAHGPGLEQLATGRQADFVVEPNGTKGTLSVTAVGPSGQEIPCEVTQGEDGNSSCSYLPKVSGQYTVTITLNDLNVTGSPFTLQSETDVSDVEVFGPGLKGGLAEESASFTVNPRGTGEDAELTVTVRGPSGEEVPATLAREADGSWGCSYDPKVPGDYEVSLLLDGHHLPGSPYTVRIEPNVAKIRVHGPGLEKAEVGEAAVFYVEPNGQDGELRAVIRGPSGEEAPIAATRGEDGCYTCEYQPTEAGEHEVSISMSGRELPASPFRVTVQADVSSIKASGPGLQGATACQPATFVVEPNGVEGDLEVTVKTPGGELLPVQIAQDSAGNFSCSYEPSGSGLHTVELLLKGRQAAQSPYQVHIDPDISKVVATGPGLEAGEVGAPGLFGVEVNGQDGEVEALVQQPDGEVLDVAVVKNADGDYECEYVPALEGEHSVLVTVDGKDIPSSPFRLVIQPEGGAPRHRVVDRDSGKRKVRDGFKAGKSAFFMGSGVSMAFAADEESAKRLSYESLVQAMKRVVEAHLEVSHIAWETDLVKLTEQIDQRLGEIAEEGDITREFLEFEVVSELYTAIRTMPFNLQAGLALTLKKFQEKGLPKVPIFTSNADDFLELVMGRFPMLLKETSPKKIDEAEISRQFVIHVHGIFTRKDDFPLSTREYLESSPHFLSFFKAYNARIRRSLVMVGCHRTLFDLHLASFFDWYDTLYEDPLQKTQVLAASHPAFPHVRSALEQLQQEASSGRFGKIEQLEEHLQAGLLAELGPGGAQEEPHLHRVLVALKDKLGEFTRKAAWAREISNVARNLERKLREVVKDRIAEEITQHYWIVRDGEAAAALREIEAKGWARIVAVVEYGAAFEDLPPFLEEIAAELAKK